MESRTKLATLTKQASKSAIEKKTFLQKIKTALRKDWQLYALIAGPLIYIFIFRYIPIVGNIIAFRRFSPGGSILGDEWVGFHFFRMFINDASFWNAFKNTFIIGVLTLLFTFPMPIILALLLNEIKALRFKKLVQTISYLPHFLSVVVLVGMIMELTAANGPINQWVEWVTGERILFMQEAGWFRTIFVTSRVWQTTGWGTILYLAALTNIDPTLYEAAKVDGANRWYQTVHVTLPGIMPTIITLLILNVGGVMAVGFEQILLMYNPLTFATADVISTYVFRVGMQANNFSYATAIGLFESIIGITFITSANLIARKLTDRSLW